METSAGPKRTKRVRQTDRKQERETSVGRTMEQV